MATNRTEEEQQQTLGAAIQSRKEGHCQIAGVGKGKKARLCSRYRTLSQGLLDKTCRVDGEAARFLVYPKGSCKPEYVFVPSAEQIAKLITRRQQITDQLKQIETILDGYHIPAIDPAKGEA